MVGVPLFMIHQSLEARFLQDIVRRLDDDPLREPRSQRGHVSRPWLEPSLGSRSCPSPENANPVSHRTAGLHALRQAHLRAVTREIRPPKALTRRTPCVRVRRMPARPVPSRSRSLPVMPGKSGRLEYCDCLDFYYHFGREDLSYRSGGSRLAT